VADAADIPARQRLLSAGAAVFAEKGYEGGSTRDVCARAETSNNMVHHYFGSKAGLLDAIVEQYGEHVLAVPMRLLAMPAKSRDDFVSRVEMLFVTTLEASLEHRNLLRVVMREDASPPALVDYADTFVRFLDDGKQHGLVREDLDTTMITGAMLDRIINQVLYIPGLSRAHGVDVTDPDYRQRWCASNVDFFVHGMLPSNYRNIP